MASAIKHLDKDKLLDDKRDAEKRQLERLVVVARDAFFVHVVMTNRSAYQ
jgi:hypothetical protein